MAKTLSAWERLTSIATLGTRRAPLPEALPWPDASLAETLSGSSEAALLRLAAATRLWELAGVRSAPAISDAVARSPAGSTDTFVSEIAAWRLARMINGDSTEFIGEWFELAAASRRAVPPQWLPIVFEGVPRPVRDRHPSVLGAAASWLAQFNPAWAVVPDSMPQESQWLEGTFDERRARLTAMRRHDPAIALEWVKGTWAEESAEAREAFLQVLETGLSNADEAFLEAALDDKRKAVRQAAVELLNRLPASAHAERARERIAPFIGLEEHKGLLMKLRKRKLAVELPVAIDTVAQRDGIETKPPAARKIGERAFWLTQMVEQVPPQFWTERFGIDAGAMLDAALATDYAQDLLSALSDAAVRHPARDWLEALCAAWLESKHEPGVVVQAISRLIAAAPVADRGTLLASQARKFAAKDASAFIWLLSSTDVAWTPELTTFAIQHVCGLAGGDRQGWSHARNSLDEWGRRCDIATAAAMLPNAVAAIDDRSPWRTALEQLNDIVDFRAAMRRELT